ncbi:MAG: ATP-binding protein [Christensenellaceae bacterium]|jgi:DNA replication protein DnaC|nr:ATP-binding protein [Christensenellaceae bacterium]
MNKQKILNEVDEILRQQEFALMQLRANELEVLRADKKFLAAEKAYRSALVAFAKNEKDKSLKTKYDLAKREYDAFFKSAPEVLTEREVSERVFIEKSNIKCKQNDFRTDKIKGKIEEYKKVYAALNSFAEKFPKVRFDNIVISGGSGTGKTEAAQILGKKLAARGFFVYFATASEIIKKQKEYFFNGSYADENESFNKCDVLIIDDLGTEPQYSNITKEYLYNIINARYGDEKSFIITTNVAIEQIKEIYDERLWSRIFDKDRTAVLSLNGADLRL